MSSWSFSFRDEDSGCESDEQLQDTTLATLTVSRVRIDSTTDGLLNGNQRFPRSPSLKTAPVNVVPLKPDRHVALDDGHVAHQTRKEGRALVEHLEREADRSSTISARLSNAENSLAATASLPHLSGSTPDAISSSSTYSRDTRKSTASCSNYSLQHSSPASSPIDIPSRFNTNSEFVGASKRPQVQQRIAFKPPRTLERDAQTQSRRTFLPLRPPKAHRELVLSLPVSGCVKHFTGKRESTICSDWKEGNGGYTKLSSDDSLLSNFEDDFELPPKKRARFTRPEPSDRSSLSRQNDRTTRSLHGEIPGVFKVDTDADNPSWLTSELFGPPYSSPSLPSLSLSRESGVKFDSTADRILIEVAYRPVRKGEYRRLKRRIEGRLEGQIDLGVLEV